MIALPPKYFQGCGSGKWRHEEKYTVSVQFGENCTGLVFFFQ